ncbi:MAG: hypothetical protein AABW68_05295 [archaeon]
MTNSNKREKVVTDGITKTAEKMRTVMRRQEEINREVREIIDRMANPNEPIPPLLLMAIRRKISGERRVLLLQVAQEYHFYHLKIAGDEIQRGEPLTANEKIDEWGPFHKRIQKLQKMYDQKRKVMQNGKQIETNARELIHRFFNRKKWPQ